MKYEVLKSPAYSVLKVELAPGEKVTAEAGAMMAMEGDLSIETKTAGGAFKGLLRRFTVGESVFVNTFVAGAGGGTVWLAPPVPGEITYYELRGEGLLVQDTSYLAHHGDVDYELKWRGLRGLIAEGAGGLVWMRLFGTGGAWLNSYGGIVEKELKAGEKIAVDNYHLVAFQDTIDFNVRKFGGWKSFLFGGEGLVLELHGPGKVLLQTRMLPGFAEVLSRFLPKGR